MYVSVIDESGYAEALFGIGLSFGLTSEKTIVEMIDDKGLWERLDSIAHKLAHKSGGENKFLRQLSVILDIDAPLYWWKEMDTYKIGTTAQSESTMHSIMKNEFSIFHFEVSSLSGIGLEALNHTIDVLNVRRLDYINWKNKNAETAKEAWYDIINLLPSSWLQRRIISCNYAVLQNIYNQRHNHKLNEWHIFCNAILEDLTHPEFIVSNVKDLI